MKRSICLSIYLAVILTLALVVGVHAQMMGGNGSSATMGTRSMMGTTNMGTIMTNDQMSPGTMGNHNGTMPQTVSPGTMGTPNGIMGTGGTMPKTVGPSIMNPANTMGSGHMGSFGGMHKR